MAVLAGGPEILSKKLRKFVERNISEDESIEFCLRTSDPVWSQAIIALEDRLLVIKPGFMAGATGGGRVTSFYYKDINGIEVNTGWVSGVIEINTPSYEGRKEKDFWSTFNKDTDPYRVTNCLPIAKFDLKEYKPYIDKLRLKIREAKREQTKSNQAASVSSGGNFAAELERLVSLQESGILTKEEFQQAKKKLLD